MASIRDFLGDLKVLLAAATQKPPADTDQDNFALLVESHAERSPDAVALLCEGEQETWRGLNERANRAAQLLKARGVGLGDCVSLFMQNRIEFVVQVVAIAKLGATVGLINTNLKRQQLVHCINLIESKKCVFGEELTEPLNEVREELNLADGKDYLWVRDTGNGPAPNWAVELDSRDTETPATNLPQTREVPVTTTAFYVFTSGTTGLPKAAVMSHKRLLPTTTMAAKLLLRIGPSDRMYNCLPLYHATGLAIGLIATFQVGASSVLRRRLSVSAFWEDIRKHDCTCFVYIGEFIRYLMSPPPSNRDREHKVRGVIGNGLRPDIWMEFKERFGIHRIGEFYGASEGNGGFANVFNKDCTVGLGTAPAKVIAYDVAADEVVRGEDGHCIEQPKGEPGLLLIEITDKSKFEGYTSDEASERKVLRDVLTTGDAYFNTGDLMREVDVGFAFGQTHYQFVDRVGDTFRWKSENVSTNEVGEIINQHPHVAVANVYGVEIPGTDGRAGMAALILSEGVSGASLDVAGLSQHINENLPAYARPVFIRVLSEQPTTATHKLQKNDLREQAFHIGEVQDDLLVRRPGEDAYTQLDSDFYDAIMRREVSF